MRKICHFIVLVAGINSIFKGIYGLFALNLDTIFVANSAYNYGDILGKVARIVFGLFIIKYVYDFYCNEKRGEVTD